MSVMFSSLLKNLTAATRLHLLLDKPSNVHVDAVVTILEAFIASRLAAKKTGSSQGYLWTHGKAKNSQAKVANSSLSSSTTGTMP